MKLEKLELKNFRSHQRTQFELARLNVIRGHHAVGKSSIALAIEFLLTNSCGVTDAAGRGADQLLMHGADEFGVRGSIGLSAERKSPGAFIQRSRNKAGGNLIITTGSEKKKNLVAKQAEAWLDEKFAPRAVLSAVLNAQRFLKMAERERKQLLTMALAADPVDLSEDVQKAMKHFEEGTVPTCINDIGETEFYYKKFYELRREKNAVIRDLGALQEPDRPQGMPSAEDTRKKVDSLRAEVAEFAKQRAIRLANQQGNRERMARAEQDLEEYKPQLLNEQEMTALDKQAGKKQTAAELDEQISQAKFDIQRSKRELTELKADPGNCRTCGRPMVKADAREQINHVEHKLEITTSELAELERRRLPLGNPLDAEQKLVAHRRAVPKVAAAEKTIAELSGKDDSVDTGDLDGKIVPLSERIRKGEEVLAAIHKFEGEMAAYQREKKAREQLDGALLKLQQLVDYFGPNGELRPKLVGDKLAGFAARLNQVLKRFGFFCEIKLEPFSVQVSYLEKWKAFDLAQLSESEEFRFGVAFQVALAEATGVNLVVIDRADLLLPGVQRFLDAALMESDLDQAFILAAKEDLALKQMPPAGVRIFDLEKDADGHTQIAAVHQAENEELEYAAE